MVARASKFSQQWQDAKSEKSLGQDFWRDFLSIFGIAERRTGIFEYHAQRHSTGKHGWIDFLIPGEFAIEQKSRGEDLDDAMQQLADYMVHLPQVLLPHTLVACDFGTFFVRDVLTGQETRFALADLAKNLDPFISLAGYQRQGDTSTRADEVEVNVQATLHLAHIHERLAATKYPTHDTGLLLTRLLYCLFADDTGIWDKALFYDWLVTKTAEDGSDLGAKLTELFAVLDTPKDKRQTNLDADLKEYTYINGGLFRENLRPATFDKDSRDDLLAACVYDWSLISPSIFGSLFQNVMNETPDLRRRLGAHYTTRAGIAAVIQPLFLDDLYERFEVAKARAVRYRLGALRALRNELSALTFFDPSCGSGNFLVESYLALRRLETAVLVAIRDEEMKGETGFIQTADASIVSNVRTSQFYGIEIEEFPAQVAETAMHIADHIANLELSAAFGHTYARLPLEDNLNILSNTNALRCDWNDLLPASQCSYVFGNPPFGGQYQKTEEQTADLRLVWGKGYNGYLDYVTGWYRKAADYIAGGTYAGKPEPRVAFVSTNSICQGEPVAPLWQPLFNEGFSIDFAHRTFRWTSEASGKAGVHCVIVGWSRGQGKPKPTVYERDMRSSVEVDPVVSQARHLNAYLADAPDVFVTPRTTPLSSSLPQVDYGSKIADGGHLLVSAEEYEQVAADPRAAKYLRRFVGAREVMHSLVKWCLWLDDVTPEDLSASPVLRERVEAVRVFRSEPGRDKEVAEAALRPTVFLRDKQPREPYVCIPRHTSHNYTRYALQHFEPNVVTGDHNFRASDPDGFLFALMSSSMFMAWTRGVAGRIRADLRFSKTLVWHNFPVPAVNEAQRTDIITKGQAVLAARAEKPERTLAQMYSPNGMWASLASAHVALDKAVDKAFGCKSSPRSDEARLSVLFEHYLELTEETLLDKA